MFLPAEVPTNSLTSNNVYSWKTTGMSHEAIKNPSTSDNSFAPKWNTDFSPQRIKLNGDCLQQDSVSFLHKKVVIYISYKLNRWSKDLNTDFK